MMQFYENIWMTKGHEMTRWKTNDMENALKFFDKYLGWNILDIGCGDGDFTAFLAEERNVTAVDISMAAIKIAKEKHPNLNLIQASCENLPFPDGYFSTVFMCETLEHIPDVTRALKEVKRVLKTGGNAIIIVPVYNKIKNLAIAAFYWDEVYNPTGEHLRFFSENGLERAINSAGMSLVDKKTTGFPIPKHIIGVAKNG